MITQNVIRYWLTSLADAELVSLNLERNPHKFVSLESISDGQIPIKSAKDLFHEYEKSNPITDGPKEDHKDWISVIVAPIVAYRKTNNQRKKTPLYPLLIPAGLQKNGQLFFIGEFTKPWIPRNLLEPTASDIVLGDVSMMDEFFSSFELSLSEEFQENWKRVLSFGFKMLNNVTDSAWKANIQEAGFTQQKDALLVNVEKISGMATNIIRVYDRLLSKKVYPKLLSTITTLESRTACNALSVDQWKDIATKHLGSFQNQFSLAPSQRQALNHSLLLQEGDILSVSGPPGTGKTTLLHSIVASLWVDAAVQKKEPPIIVVTSTNNQAVVNVLDSLHGFKELDRWLPITSFGLYLVNRSDKQTWAQGKDVLFVDKTGDGFPTEIENIQAINKFKDQYLEKCSESFGYPLRQVNAAVDALHNKLIWLKNIFITGLSIAYEYHQLAKTIGNTTEYDQQIKKVQVKLDEKQKALEDIQNLRMAWLKHCQQEPLWYGLLTSLAPIAQRRKYRNQQFLMQFLPDLQLSPDHDAIEKAIQERFESQRADTELLNKQFQELVSRKQRLQKLEKDWANWCQDHGNETLKLEKLTVLETNDGEVEPGSLLNWLDLNLRYELLSLASHYWEGRWLQEVSKIVGKGGDFVRPGVQLSQESRFRRYAMLTPCFVTTMHSGPSFFDYYSGQSEPLLEYIDWLIIDEAGQVSPEVAGGMFALAKRAIVVGDEKQIEPVWNIPEQIDRANMERIGLVKNDKSYMTVLDKGLSAASGSVMRMSMHASLYKDPDVINEVRQPGGLLLTEHRRCVPEIIGYCNELAYGGQLKPKRPSLEEYPWPHLGYLHIKGRCERNGGSRLNWREARTIVTWIEENRTHLETHHETSIGKIIGIITPFAAQKRLLRQVLKESKLDTIKFGTVHTFQGAENPVIIFSPVYTSLDRDNYFFDRGVNMLNVAVSRAKDSFIVVGDMDIFNPMKERPSGLLARYLFDSEDNELGISDIPTRKDAGVSKKIHYIRSLDKHVGTLRRAFEKAEYRLFIVSPFLRWRAVKADQIAEKTAEAVGRGVEVIVCTDMSFNDGLDLPEAKKAAEALSQAGAKIIMCRNIHSKVICVDDSIFIEGSFNWLSAERVVDKYVRHDTSIIYMGEQVADFIDETLNDLRTRVIKQI